MPNSIEAPDLEACSQIIDESQAILLGLSVLSCLLDRRKPSSEETQRLRSLLPEMADRPLDELACAVVKNFSAPHA